jgi:hypothetical protein
VFLAIGLLATHPEAMAGTPRFNQPLGEVRGTLPAQVSFDGRSWTALGSGALPVFDGTRIRARSGIVAVTLLDGSGLEVSPTTELAITKSGSLVNVLMAQGNVLFRLPPSSQARLSVPGGFVQTDAFGATRPGGAVATRVSTTRQGGRDTLGVITLQKSGIPRVRVVSGEVLLVSQNGFARERIREGQARTILAQSSGAVPLKRYAEAHQVFSILPPLSDPPGKETESGFVWGYNPANPQAGIDGWEQVRIGTPPDVPLPPDQELRRGFAWAWEVPAARWIVVRRECHGVPAFLLRAGASPSGAAVPPPTDPPSKEPGPGQVWAWNASNPPDVLGGWAPAKLGEEPTSPPRPEQELKDGFVWAWNQPQGRWDVVEECDLAAAFLLPAGPGLIPLLGAGAGVGVVSTSAALLTSGGGTTTSTASNAAP